MIPLLAVAGILLGGAPTAGAGGADAAGAAGMRRVEGGRYTPFYPVEDETDLAVDAFLLDERPVSNGEFRDFVRENPRWRRSRAPELFRDAAYLSHWQDDLGLGNARADQPVTFVSYFAAAAYCHSQDKRLPTEAEWEWAAYPDPDDPESGERVSETLRAFYARPRTELPPAGSTAPNRFGIRDLHGVIWEWVGDFNATLASGDNRQDSDQDFQRFCGGASIGADDVRDYPAFMRFAFRSSLEARYALHHLGFRCARSLP